MPTSVKTRAERPSDISIETMVGPVPVLVVEDHPLMRSAVTATLEGSGSVTVVAAVGDGPAAIDEYRRARLAGVSPLVLCDLSLPCVDGIAVLRALLEFDADATVVLFTAHGDRSSVVTALDAGARGFVMKTADPDDLISALRAAAAGEIVFDPQTAAALAGERASVRRGDVSGAALSPRELEVLQALSRGLTTADIANELFLGNETVRTHIKQIFRKLEVNDRAGAVAKAFRTRLVH